MDAVLGRLVRVGIVSAVNAQTEKARVVFEDMNLVSGWLRVLQHPGAAVTVAPDAAHSHTIHDTYTGGGSASTFPAHDHPGSRLARWMPEVGTPVLCLYLPVENGDGYILGAL